MRRREPEFYSAKTACHGTKLQPARFLNCEILISRRVVIARQKSKSKRRSAGSAAFKFSPADLCLSRARAACEAACLNFKFTPPDADFAICAQRKSVISRSLLRTIKFNRAGRRAMRANLKRAVFITAQISSQGRPIKAPPQAGAAA